MVISRDQPQVCREQSSLHPGIAYPLAFRILGPHPTAEASYTSPKVVPHPGETSEIEQTWESPTKSHKRLTENFQIFETFLEALRSSGSPSFKLETAEAKHHQTSKSHLGFFRTFQVSEPFICIYVSVLQCGSEAADKLRKARRCYGLKTSTPLEFDRLTWASSSS